MRRSHGEARVWLQVVPDANQCPPACVSSLSFSTFFFSFHFFERLWLWLLLLLLLFLDPGALRLLRRRRVRRVRFLLTPLCLLTHFIFLFDRFLLLSPFRFLLLA
jgi:hypothetical protein